MSGTIHTLGYAAFGAVEALERLMADPSVLLVDVRRAARSRWMPQWNKNQLRQRWGDRYWHLPALGNVNYKQRGSPIKIADLEGGMVQLLPALRAGAGVVLLCACTDYEHCHRKQVAEALMQALASDREGQM